MFGMRYGMRKIRFRRLGLFYLIALGCIALSILVSQLLVQTSINRQQDDARVINVAGRQRMLSQKISKVALKLQNQGVPNSDDLTELKEALTLWTLSHEGLIKGESTLGLGGSPSLIIQKMFSEISLHYDIIRNNASALLDIGVKGKEKMLYVQEILQHEGAFLEGMDRIVFQYDYEAQEKVKDLRKKELYLFVISLLIIILELIFVFAPLARHIRRTVQHLTESEASSQNMLREISKLYEELGNHYQDLEAVNITPESPSLYASINSSGTFTYLSDQFISIMEYSEKSPPQNIQELLKTSKYQSDFAEGLQKIFRERKNWTGELCLINEPGDLCWFETHFIPTHPTDEIKMVARDITQFKEAKLRSRELNKERIEKSVKAQQYRSALILQGQEEERKRLSQELHDGVGQMLSAMKFLLESLPASSGPQRKRLIDAKSLMKSIIQEVRRVSFNLTPSSLSDFGLVPAIHKFCEEIDAVTKTDIQFMNETRFINRLDASVETNLYRIIQEAVNNALKYAKSSKITVKFNHTMRVLNISIADDGKGFNYHRVEKSGHFEKAGHGIFNMKERAAYIGGTLEIKTEIEKGTKILVNIPLNQND